MKARDIAVAAIAIAVTAAAGVVALNFRTGEKQIEQTVTRLYATSDPQFARAMGVLLGPPIVEGNRFEVLLNGDAIFPPMLAAISGARETITFESYIYWSGAVGRAFAEALAERARAGVRVISRRTVEPTVAANMKTPGTKAVRALMKSGTAAKGSIAATAAIHTISVH